MASDWQALERQSLALPARPIQARRASECIDWGDTLAGASGSYHVGATVCAIRAIRALVQEKIQEILGRKGPHPKGEPIVVNAEMSDAEFERFRRFTGYFNDDPFGGAPAGTLEIRPSSGRKDGNVELSFWFHRQPPDDVGLTRGLQRPIDPAGKPQRIKPCVDFNTVPDLVFPADREELEAMKKGQRNDALVPVSPRAARSLGPGKTVSFIEARTDPFGALIYEPGGDSLTVSLIEVRDENYRWGSKNLYDIVWEPLNMASRRGPRDPETVNGGDRPRKGHE